MLVLVKCSVGTALGMHHWGSRLTGRTAADEPSAAIACKRETSGTRRIRDEFEAYARLDARLHGNDVRALARRVCRLVAKKSAFQRVAHAGAGRRRTDVCGGQRGDGGDHRSGAACVELTAWRRRTRRAATERETAAGIRVGEKSFAVVLGKDSADIGCGRAIIVPLWTSAGQMRGALAVCADRLMTLRRQTVEETIPPLEALAVKLGRAHGRCGLTGRLERAEKLAGLGLLASGVAHALSNPLTSVLGFAELIAETAKEPRVRADAEMIVHEARRMQQTVQESDELRAARFAH